MRAYEVLFEFKIEKVYKDSKEVIVMINPPPAALRNMFEKALYNEVRGLFDGKKFYFWAAHNGIHKEIAELLGVEYQERFRLSIGAMSDPEGGERLLRLEYADSRMMEIYKRFLYMQKTFRILVDHWEYFILK